MLHGTAGSELLGQVDEALRTLTPQEEEVLRLLYGIGTLQRSRRSEVTGELGITLARARSIEASALQRLRRVAMDGLDEVEGECLASRDSQVRQPQSPPPPHPQHPHDSTGSRVGNGTTRWPEPRELRRTPLPSDVTSWDEV